MPSQCSSTSIVYTMYAAEFIGEVERQTPSARSNRIGKLHHCKQSAAFREPIFITSRDSSHSFDSPTLESHTLLTRAHLSSSPSLTTTTPQNCRLVRWSSTNTPTGPATHSLDRKGWENRITEIRNVYHEPYPRMAVDKRSISSDEFHSKYDYLKPNETAEQDYVVIYAVIGHPHRTSRRELSVAASQLPKLITPCLHDVPLRMKYQESSPYDRHVQLLYSPTAADILRARSSVIQYIRSFFLDRSFMEVETPILASVAGGLPLSYGSSAWLLADSIRSLRLAHHFAMKGWIKPTTRNSQPVNSTTHSPTWKP
ncbi:lysyl-tRNA synthetase [Histoplasma capsulatum]|uniref:Lysyl-tRNA synthetase n=1 Tax=Ajellomyces capsulatus TaxID=5037 RepID=A0A8A1MA58_AJECA|nr:lysyl-tRNA synthetase [Histoplasma capsulatum]